MTIQLAFRILIEQAPPFQEVPANSLEFWVWHPGTRGSELPTGDERYMGYSYVHPLVQCKPRFPDKPNDNAPGYGPYGDTGSIEGGTPDMEASGDQVWGWCRYYLDLYVGAGREASSIKWSMFWNGWGKYNEESATTDPRNGGALWRNAGDAVSFASSPTSSFAGVAGFFHAAGLAEVPDQTTAIAERVEANRVSHGVYGEPYAYWNDVEGPYDYRYIAEWWEAAVLDERFDTEVVASGGRTLSDLALGIPDVDFGSNFAADNEFTKFLRGYVELNVIEYVVGLGIHAPLKGVWENLVVSNYNWVPGSEMKEVQLKLPFHTSRDWTPESVDRLSPEMYGVPFNSYEGRKSEWDQAIGFNGTGSAASDWFDFNLAFCKYRLDQIAAHEFAGGLVPWIAKPGERMTFEQTVELMEYAKGKGVVGFILFFGEPYDWSDLVDQVRPVGSSS